MDDAAPRTDQKVNLTFSQTDLIILKSMISQYGDLDQFGTATRRLADRLLKAGKKLGIEPQHRRVG